MFTFFYSVILLRGIYLKEIIGPAWKDLCSKMFIAALFSEPKTIKTEYLKHDID